MHRDATFQLVFNGFLFEHVSITRQTTKDSGESEGRADRYAYMPFGFTRAGLMFYQGANNYAMRTFTYFSVHAPPLITGQTRGPE